MQKKRLKKKLQKKLQKKQRLEKMTEVEMMIGHSLMTMTARQELEQNT